MFKTRGNIPSNMIREVFFMKRFCFTLVVLCAAEVDHIAQAEGFRICDEGQIVGLPLAAVIENDVVIEAAVDGFFDECRKCLL